MTATTEIRSIAANVAAEGFDGAARRILAALESNDTLELMNQAELIGLGAPLPELGAQLGFATMRLANAERPVTE